MEKTGQADPPQPRQKPSREVIQPMEYSMPGRRGAEHQSEEMNAGSWVACVGKDVRKDLELASVQNRAANSLKTMIVVKVLTPPKKKSNTAMVLDSMSCFLLLR